jgi:RNA polymerase sigma-70 factor (ECF subfamily)
MNAYERIVRDHHALVYRVALGIVRDPATAEDIAQDVFLDFLRHPEPLARAGNVRAFVGRAAVHRALKARRSGERRDRRELAWSESRRATMDPVETAFRNELRAKVAELPEDQRVAVDLHYFQGFTMREAGLALDVPAGTVSSRISSALATLRRAISAAAFVALMARLERELSACEAPPVPTGLASRLMSLDPAISRSHGLASLASRKSGLACGALVLALLLAVTTGNLIVVERDGAAEKEISDDAAASEEAAIGPVAPDNAVAVTAWQEITIEGFLFRVGDQLYVGVERVPEPVWLGVKVQMELLRLDEESARAVDAALLGGYPAGSTCDFTAFLQRGGPASLAPHARVKVRARVPAETVKQLTFQRVISKEAPEHDRVGELLAALGEIREARVAAVEVRMAEVEAAKTALSNFNHEIEVILNREFSPTPAGPPQNIEPQRPEIALLDASEGDAASVGHLVYYRSDGTDLTTSFIPASDGTLVPLDAQLRGQTVSFLEDLGRERNSRTPAEVLEVLDVELLSDGWLEAWREIYSVAGDLAPALQLPPGDPRNAALGALARRLGDAMNSARMSRAGQSPVTWRVRMENRFAAAACATLAEAGFEAGLPLTATPTALRGLFLESSGPEEFRALLESRYGLDVLSLTVPVIRPFEAMDWATGEKAKVQVRLVQRKGVVGWEDVGVTDLLAMDPEMFAASQQATREGLRPPSEPRSIDLGFEEAGLELPSPK